MSKCTVIRESPIYRLELNLEELGCIKALLYKNLGIDRREAKNIYDSIHEVEVGLNYRTSSFDRYCPDWRAYRGY